MSRPDVEIDDLDRVWLAAGRSIRTNPAIRRLTAETLDLFTSSLRIAAKLHPERRKEDQIPPHVLETIDVLVITLRADDRLKNKGTT